jgi:UTP--glucose-1-phosphate uridylyltransferase
MSVGKAVMPVAGLGTRFLPATRSIPKMMIPVLDRPAIHFAVEEAAAAGIDHVVFVVSPGQEAVPRYFHRMPNLEAALESRGETERLRQMLAISDMVDTTTVVQERQLGLGHAVLMAREAVGDEAFAVLLPDDLIWGESPTTSAMIDLFSSCGGSVVAVNAVPEEVVPAKGVIAHVPVAERVSRVEAMVEKPALEDAPSNLAIVGRYVLTPEVFCALARVRPGALGELQLTDAIASLLPTREVYAYEFPGRYFDLGTPLGLLKASLYAALQTQGLSREALRDWLTDTL